MTLNEDECARAGVDPRRVRSIAMRIERAALEAQKLGVQIFGGSGSGSLRIYDDTHSLDAQALILAKLDGNWSGGVGSIHWDDEGLERGE